MTSNYLKKFDLSDYPVSLADWERALLYRQKRHKYDDGPVYCKRSRSGEGNSHSLSKSKRKSKFINKGVKHGK